MKKNDLKFIFLIFITVNIFSFMFPVYQVPDEMKHIQLTYDELNQEKEVFYEYGDFVDTIRMYGVYDEKVNYDRYFNFDLKLQNNLELKLPKISIIRHLPQSFGIIIGHFLNLPVIVTLALCEFLAVCFYTLACAITLKLMPVKKNVMKFIMILPILIQQMGSMSYDVTLISLSFIFIAYILNLKFKKDKIDYKDALIALGLLFCIGIIKIPYILLGLLVFLLPLNKINILGIDKEFIKKHRILFIILTIVVIILGMIVALKMSYGRILLAFITHPIELFKTLFETLKAHGTGLAYTICGNLGWLDIPVSMLYCAFIVLTGIFLVFTKEKEEEKMDFSIKDRLIIILISIIMFVVTILSLYGWTLQKNGITDINLWSFKEMIDYIKNNIVAVDGLQGRYFIPIIPVVCLCLSSKKISKLTKNINMNILNIIFYSVVIIYMFIVVLFRYWI